MRWSSGERILASLAPLASPAGAMESAGPWRPGTRALRLVPCSTPHLCWRAQRSMCGLCCSSEQPPVPTQTQERASSRRPRQPGGRNGARAAAQDAQEGRKVAQAAAAAPAPADRAAPAQVGTQAAEPAAAVAAVAAVAVVAAMTAAAPELAAAAAGEEQAGKEPAEGAAAAPQKPAPGYGALPGQEACIEGEAERLAALRALDVTGVHFGSVCRRAKSWEGEGPAAAARTSRARALRWLHQRLPPHLPTPPALPSCLQPAKAGVWGAHRQRLSIRGARHTRGAAGAAGAPGRGRRRLGRLQGLPSQREPLPLHAGARPTRASDL